MQSGVHFAVWAPSAKRVSVVGDFNGWDGRVHPMRTLVPSGLWEIFIPELGVGDHYKFEVVTPQNQLALKTDPCGRYFEIPPLTASIVWDSRELPVGRRRSGWRRGLVAGVAAASDVDL